VRRFSAHPPWPSKCSGIESAKPCNSISDLSPQRNARALNAVRATSIFAEGVKSEDGNLEEGEDESGESDAEKARAQAVAAASLIATTNLGAPKTPHAAVNPSPSPTPAGTPTPVHPAPPVEPVEIEKHYVIAIYDCNANVGHFCIFSFSFLLTYSWLSGETKRSLVSKGRGT
jgi:hypothetical protein